MGGNAVGVFRLEPVSEEGKGGEVSYDGLFSFSSPFPPFASISIQPMSELKCYGFAVVDIGQCEPMLAVVL
jgi:hypothetical protein